MNVERLVQQLVLHEGVSLHAYLDTLDNETLGVGYNVTARGVEFFERTIGRALVPPTLTCTKAEALLVLRADIARIEPAVRLHFSLYDTLNDPRQRVVMDMAFNLGFGALNFKACIAAIVVHDWSTAARELYKSRWAYQVGDGPGGRFDRADRLAGMLLTGQDYTR